jgi:hypothetical protein
MGLSSNGTVLIVRTLSSVVERHRIPEGTQLAARDPLRQSEGIAAKHIDVFMPKG